MTYREVVTEIEQYEKMGEQCMITVHSNIEGEWRGKIAEKTNNGLINWLMSGRQMIHQTVTLPFF